MTELRRSMGLVGLEPTTSRLKARYSTIELQTQIIWLLFSCQGADRGLSQPPLKNTTGPSVDQVDCASSRIGFGVWGLVPPPT